MVVVVVVVAAAAAAAAPVVVVVVVVHGGKLAFGCFGAHTFSTKGQAFGAARVYWRVAQGQRGGGMRVLGVFENWAGKCVCLI